MENKQGSLDYKAFMEWFKEHYPLLYAKHHETISVPSDGEGVTVGKDKMDERTYKILIGITKEYYREENQ